MVDNQGKCTSNRVAYIPEWLESPWRTLFSLHRAHLARLKLLKSLCLLKGTIRRTPDVWNPISAKKTLLFGI